MVKVKKPTTIFQKSQKEQRAYSLPKESPEWTDFLPPQTYLRQGKIDLPEISELDLTRHFSRLANQNMSIDTHFYPLGSCTMKLNPRVTEAAVQFPGFKYAHPLAPQETVQGCYEVIVKLLEELCYICGLHAGTLVANAGAQGEFVGIKMIRAYHESKGHHKKKYILIPDSAHGTNPASARMCGYQVITLKSDPKTGDVDLEDLKENLSDEVAGLMLTNPNTLGIFSPQILEISKLVHDAGGLLYYDGANLNPILNICKPGRMGFDVMHINLHKTFSTPHGGGGPGGAPVLCNEKLEPFLPTPWVHKRGEHYQVVWKAPSSIGATSTFFGNFSILVRAYLYIRLHGQYGLRKIAEMAILNANYLKFHLSDIFNVPIKGYCMHEFVVQADRYLDKGVRAFDIAKRLLDYGIHAPTIYFPLIIKECMLIEPTESESKDTLDHFIKVLKMIVQEINEDPEKMKSAPHKTSLKRLDEVYAAKALDILE